MISKKKLDIFILKKQNFIMFGSSMEKINNHMPTPLSLQCFCEQCNIITDQSHLIAGQASSTQHKELNQRHVYNLYSVIMHQGATMTAGHYVAYTRLPSDSVHAEYQQCQRDCTHRQYSNQVIQDSYRFPSSLRLLAPYRVLIITSLL
jgi:ubiquitin carboxyl-terminal hydrolase 1